MNRSHFKRLSDCPFKSCGEFTLSLFEVKLEASSARRGEKSVLRRATGTGNMPEQEEN
jgi:hypothetical protein